MSAQAADTDWAKGLMLSAAATNASGIMNCSSHPVLRATALLLMHCWSMAAIYFCGVGCGAAPNRMPLSRSLLVTARFGNHSACTGSETIGSGESLLDD
jgi:hypothetical protein